VWLGVQDFFFSMSLQSHDESGMPQAQANAGPAQKKI
jgi:hypothetical protein